MNENASGLLRQFFPKSTRFTRLSRAEIKRVQAPFNDRNRKILDWLTFPLVRFLSAIYDLKRSISSGVNWNIKSEGNLFLLRRT